MKNGEVKFGAILSYLLIVSNALYGLLISPYLMSTIGVSEYGVYKTIGSLTATLVVLELGLGGTMQRYIAKFNAEKNYEASSNFSAMGLVQAVALSAIIVVGAIFLYFTITPTYGKTFSAFELVRAKQLFVLQIVHIVIHFFENVLFGIISGYNKFIFINITKLSSIVLKVLLYVIILPIFKTSLIIIGVVIFLEISIVCVELIFISKKLHHNIRLYKWDGPLFKETFAYTILLFVQTIIIQFNGNVDNIVIGAVIGTSAVTIYSFALQIFNMYETCATAVSGVVLPTIINKIHSGATSQDLEKTVCKYGRVQWAFLGAALFGFICFGKEFFVLWLGKDFADCWLLSLILMIPVTFPLIVNVCLAILKAKNLLGFRTVSMGYALILNSILTIVGTRYYGYWAAAVGTAASTIVGSIISMNIYYHKKLDMNMFKLYFNIFKKITLCLVVATAFSLLVMNRYFYGSWISLVFKACVFMAIYVAMLFVYGLNNEEKNIFKIKRRKA